MSRSVKVLHVLNPLRKEKQLLVQNGTNREKEKKPKTSKQLQADLERSEVVFSTFTVSETLKQAQINKRNSRRTLLLMKTENAKLTFEKLQQISHHMSKKTLNRLKCFLRINISLIAGD